MVIKNIKLSLTVYQVAFSMILNVVLRVKANNSIKIKQTSSKEDIGRKKAKGLFKQGLHL